MRIAQKYLGEEIVLDQISTSSQEAYADWLNKKTKLLQKELKNRPWVAMQDDVYWGTARKALNLFMRDVVYNKYFGFSKLESWLEVPLDSKVAEGLKNKPGGNVLPRWRTLKGLESSDSQKFQEFAGEYAKTQKIERVHLDIYLFLEDR